jgi:predicted CopG family antitoxin
METVTARVESDTYEEIQDRADGERSKSAVTRELIEKGMEAEAIEADRDRLQRQLGQLIEQRDEHQELAKYVDEEQTWREAPVWKRAKWWLMGKPGTA